MDAVVEIREKAYRQTANREREEYRRLK